MRVGQTFYDIWHNTLQPYSKSHHLGNPSPSLKAILLHPNNTWSNIQHSPSSCLQDIIVYYFKEHALWYFHGTINMSLSYSKLSKSRLLKYACKRWYLLDLPKTWFKTKYIFTYGSIKILWTLVKQVIIVTLRIIWIMLHKN